MSEQLSALMDGELSEPESARLIQALKSDDLLSQAWNAYHMLGDDLRNAPHVSAGFTAMVMQRLASEPTVLAPRRKPARPVPRFSLPIAASVAAVSLVGILSWQLTRMNQAAQPALIAAAPAVQQNVAQAAPETSQQMKPTAPQHVQFATAASNSYLLAHQEFSPSYAMEGMPAYVRTLSEQQEGNR